MAVVTTRITKLFNIKVPIILPGMSWISTPPLVAAVSNAGGLGILATGPLSADQTRESIRQVRKLTDKPFGIGATLLMPGAEANVEVALQEKVPVVNFSLGKGDYIVKRVHEYGGKVMATVVNEKHARSAESAGVDALMVTGHEAAAHGGDVTSMVLVPALASRVGVPIVSAGGYASGHGLLAALSLGADGVAMGTRLATTTESPLAEAVKQAIVRGKETDTIYSKNFDGLHARVMKTKAAEAACRRPTNPIVAAYLSFGAAKTIGMPLWKVIPGLLTKWTQMYQLALFGGATQKLMAATIHGDLDTGVQFVGQSQGLVGGIMSVEEVLDMCVQEAVEAHVRNAERFSFERDYDEAPRQPHRLSGRSILHGIPDDP